MKQLLLAPARVAWGVAKIVIAVVKGVLFVCPGLPLLGLLHLLNELHVHGGGQPLRWCAGGFHDWDSWQHGSYESVRDCGACGKRQFSGGSYM